MSYIACLPTELVIIPTVLSLPHATIARPSDGGTSNVKINSSDPSAILSLITCTLTLLIVIPAANVAVSVAVAKSTSPVSQTLFSQHRTNNIHNTTHGKILAGAKIGKL